MENKMVEPSNKRVVIAVLAVLVIIGIIYLVMRGYLQKIPPIQLLQNQSETSNTLDAGEFTIQVPPDWDHTSPVNESSHTEVDVFEGPVISDYLSCAGSSKTFNHFWLEIKIEPFSANDEYASFKQYYENQTQSDGSSYVTLIDELEVGGQTPLSIYALPPLEKCNLGRFTGMSFTQDGKLVLLSSRGPAADYQRDFKELFQSITLK